MLIFAITVTGILANTLINAPLPDILEYFDQPDSQAGVLVAAASLPGILVAPVIGILADRYGRRRVLLPCLVTFGLAGVAAAVAPSFALVVLARLAQGFGSAGLINLAVVLIADHWEGIERARLIGYNAAVLTVSVALFPALGGALAELGSWRWSFVPYATALLTAVAVAIWLPASAGRTTTTVRAQLRDAVAVVRRRTVAGAISFGFVLFVLIFGLFLTALPILLDDEFGLGAGARGFILSVPAAGSTVVALNLGRLRARYGGRRLLLAATVLFVVAFATIGFAPTVAVVLLGALVYGVGEGMSIPTAQDVVAGQAPEASRAAVVALWVGAARAGQTVGPLATGALLGSHAASSVFVLGAVVCVALLAAQLVVSR